MLTVSSCSDTHTHTHAHTGTYIHTRIHRVTESSLLFRTAMSRGHLALLQSLHARAPPEPFALRTDHSNAALSRPVLDWLAAITDGTHTQAHGTHKHTTQTISKPEQEA